jgi:hypothetical protein
MAIGNPVSLGTSAVKASATQTINLVAASPAGAGIVVAFVCSASASYSISDSAGNAYTLIVSLTLANNAGILYIAHSLNANALAIGNQITVTISSGSTSYVAAALSIANCLAGNFYSSGDSLTGITTTPSISNTSPAGVSYLLIGFLGVNGPLGDTFTQSSGWTSVPERAGTTGQSAASNYALEGGYQKVSAATPFTYAPTLGSARDWGMQVLYFTTPSTYSDGVTEVAAPNNIGSASKLAPATISDGGSVNNIVSAAFSTSKAAVEAVSPLDAVNGAISYAWPTHSIGGAVLGAYPISGPSTVFVNIVTGNLSEALATNTLTSATSSQVGVLTETAATLDVRTVIATLLGSSTEVLTLADVLGGTNITSASVVDVASATDSSIRGLFGIGSLTEVFAPTDSASGLSGRFSSTTESITAIDASTLSSLLVGALTESSPLVDVRTAVALLQANGTEITTSTDSVGSTLSVVRSTTESITAGDARVASAVGVGSSTEAVFLTQTSITVNLILGDGTESAIVTDGQSAVMVSSGELLEAITTDDVRLAVATLLGDASEVLVLNDVRSGYQVARGFVTEQTAADTSLHLIVLRSVALENFTGTAMVVVTDRLSVDVQMPTLAAGVYVNQITATAEVQYAKLRGAA